MNIRYKKYNVIFEYKWLHKIKFRDFIFSKNKINFRTKLFPKVTRTAHMVVWRPYGEFWIYNRGQNIIGENIKLSFKYEI